MTTSNFGLMTLQGISKPLTQIAHKKECISLMENQMAKRLYQYVLRAKRKI